MLTYLLREAVIVGHLEADLVEQVLQVAGVDVGAAADVLVHELRVAEHEQHAALAPARAVQLQLCDKTRAICYCFSA